MQFSRQSIYNAKLNPIASEIFINASHEQIAGEKIHLFERFLKIIIEEVDKKLDSFRLVVPQEFYSCLKNIDNTILKKLCIKIEVGSRDQNSIDIMEEIDRAGYCLAVDVQDQRVLERLPAKTQMLIIDADFISLLEDELTELNAKYHVVAKNIEQREQYQQLKEMGVQYFCGSFIERPESVTTDVIPPNKTAILSLMAALTDPDIELSKVEKMVVADSVLSFKILKVVNSPMYRGVSKIESVQNAIVRFGFRNLKRWIFMLSMCSMENKPSALIKIALQRAIMCSKLSDHLQVNNPEPYYTAGLLSMLDAFLDHPMKTLLAEVNLSEDLVAAITEGEGTIGKVLSIVRRYQNGDVSFKDEQLTNIFIESAEETNELMRALGL